jgi:hypothetical protein
MPTPRPEMAEICSADELEAERLGDQIVGRDAAAVVDYLDHDLVARLARRDADGAGLGLACREPVGGCLDTVVEGVADDVGEGIEDHLDHLAVHLDIAALEYQLDLFVQVVADVAHHAGQGSEEAVDALHPRLGHHVAHVGNAGGKALEAALDIRVDMVVAQLAGQLVAGQHHVRHRVHELVDE